MEAIFEGIAALVELVARIVFWVVVGLIFIAVFCFSRGYRLKKRRQWRREPGRRYLDYTDATLSVLVPIAAVVMWFAAPAVQPTQAHDLSDLQYQNSGLKVNFQRTDVSGSESSVTISVDGEGMKEIMNAEDRGTLMQSLRDHVKIHRSGDGAEQEATAGDSEGDAPSEPVEP